MKTMKASDVVINHTLYPRGCVDRNNVSNIMMAMEAGAEIPPIIVEAKTLRCVDGVHRVTAVLEKDKDGEIKVIEKKYASDKEFFLDAMRYNCGRGLDLDSGDKTHCLAIAERLRLSVKLVAGALRMPLKVLKGMKLAVPENGGKLTTAKPTQWAGRKAVERQAEEIELLNSRLEQLTSDLEQEKADREKLAVVNKDQQEKLKKFGVTAKLDISNKALNKLKQYEAARKTAEKTSSDILTRWNVEDGQHWVVNGIHHLFCGSNADSNTVAAVQSLDLEVDGICTDPPYELDAEEIIETLERFSDVAVVLTDSKLQQDLLNLDSWSPRTIERVWFHRTPRCKNAVQMKLTHHNIMTFTKTKNTDPKLKNLGKYNSGFGTENEYEVWWGKYAKSPEVYMGMMEVHNFKTVLDPYIGCGGTLLACHFTDRVCVGIDREPSQIAIALEKCKRLGLACELVKECVSV